MTILGVGIGLAIGLALALLGGGGSILTVPALVYLLHQDPHAAVATSLVIVGLNALIGAGLHARHGHVRFRDAAMFGGAGLLASFIGARLSSLLPAPLLLSLFALLMLVIAGLMLRGGLSVEGETEAPRSRMAIVLGGLGVGFLTGFLGVGGGFVVVPALVLLLHMPMRHAIGSSLVVIALNSVAGLLGHWGESPLNWGLIGLLVAGGVLGSLAGAWLGRRMPVTGLRRGFAMFVVILGLGLLIINVPALLA